MGTTACTVTFITIRNKLAYIFPPYLGTEKAPQIWLHRTASAHNLRDLHRLMLMFVDFISFRFRSSIRRYIFCTRFRDRRNCQRVKFVWHRWMRFCVEFSFSFVQITRFVLVNDMKASVIDEWCSSAVTSRSWSGSLLENAALRVLWVNHAPDRRVKPATNQAQYISLTLWQKKRHSPKSFRFTQYLVHELLNGTNQHVYYP